MGTLALVQCDDDHRFAAGSGALSTDVDLGPQGWAAVALAIGWQQVHLNHAVLQLLSTQLKTGHARPALRTREQVHIPLKVLHGQGPLAALGHGHPELLGGTGEKGEKGQQEHQIPQARAAAASTPA